MNRRRRFWLWLGLAVIGLAGLAIASGILLVRSAWFGEKVRERIVREVEESTGGDAEIGAFHFDWRAMRAEVRPFILHGTEGQGEQPLFKVRALQVGLKIVSVLRRDVDISLLRLDQPKIHIVVYPDGSTNLPQPPIARRSSRNAIERLLDLSIGELRIEDGLLELNSRVIPLDLNGAQLRARLFYDALAPSYAGRVSFENLFMKSPVTLPVGFGADFSLAVKSSEIAISEAHFFTKRSSIRAGGTIRYRPVPRAELRFDAELALPEFLQPLRLPVDARGVIKLSGSGSFAGAKDYRLDARLAGSGLELRYQKLRVTDVQAASGLNVSPGSVKLEGIRLSALGGEFAGGAFIREQGQFGVEGELRDISIQRLVRLAELKQPVWSGRVSGATSLQGWLDRWPPHNVTARSRLVVVAETGQLPLQGSLDIGYDQATGTLELGDSYLASPFSRVHFQGTLGRSLRLSVQSEKLEELMPLVSAFRPGALQSPPIFLERGHARFEGLVTGPIDDPRVSGRVALESFLFRGRRFNRFDGDIAASAASLRVRGFSLAFEDMRLRGELAAGLRDWKAEGDSSLAGSFAASNVRLDRVLSEAGSRVAVEGIASGSLTVAGTVDAPEWKVRARITEPVFYGQRFDTARLEANYANDTVDILSASLEAGKGRLLGRGSFLAPSGDWRNGTLRFEVSGNRLPLSRVAGPDRFPGVAALLEFDSRGEAAFRSAKPQLASLTGTLSIRDIQFDGQPAGEVTCVAETKENSLLVRVQGEIAGAGISGQSVWNLAGNNPVKGEIEFNRLALSSLQPWWAPTAGGAKLPLEGYADGRISFSGEGINPAGWKARVEIPSLVLAPETDEADTEVLRLTNDGPILMNIGMDAVRVERAVLSGKDTNLEVSGGIGLRPENSIQLRLRGAVNLAVLRNFDPDLTASGNSILDATVRGRLSSPEIFGRLEFKNGSFYLSDVPNGIDKASGVIAFSRDRATIERLSAETGGGKLTFGGFIGFGGDQIVYRLQADASRVRVRYPEGVSTTLDASLNLTGTSTNSTLSGNVTILRSSINPRVDLAGMLAQSSRPLITPGTQNKLLRGMLFDVRVQSSPNARLDTALTRDIQAEADLRLRGTPYKPVLLGRISATQGEVSFLGTRYGINRGDVSFLNPVKLEPVVNLDLATRVMGTEVNITFAGPLHRLNVTYRSDPPLQPGEIIALLAVGRAPSTDPTVTARQAELDQASLGQLGATTVIGEALAAPVTGRLQRFFGVSRIRIDPRLTGVENNPQTQLTLEQQVSRDVTFTYITNLSRGQEQIVRVEWNVNRRWSIVALRDENGLFGIDVLFRKQFH